MKRECRSISHNDDHSYTLGQTTFGDAPNITVYHNGTLVWGNEPGGGGGSGGSGGSGGIVDTGGTGGGESGGTGAVAQQTLPALTISLPDGMRPDSAALAATSSLRVADGVRVERITGAAAPVVNTGEDFTLVGCDAHVGDVWSEAPVDLRPRAQVHGDVVCASSVHQEPDVTITGTIQEHTSIAPLRASTWEPVVPVGPGGEVALEPGESRSLTAGAHGAVGLKAGATLTLDPGTYLMDRLIVEPDARLVVATSEDPVVLYVQDEFIFRGQVVDAQDPNQTPMGLLVIVLSDKLVPIEKPFCGTVYAPNGRVIVSGGVHHGAFLGRDVDVEPRAQIVHRAFPWSTVLPPGEVLWQDAPVILRAWQDYLTGQSQQDVQCAAEPVAFTIPEYLEVRAGNAGNGEARFEFGSSTAGMVSCTYRGGAAEAHPTSDLQRMRGRRYLFESCSNGQSAGQQVEARCFGLRVLSGDANNTARVVDISLHLGRGCSDLLPPPLSPVEVVAMREDFSWQNTDDLQVTDPEGRPAIWHGLIYIDRKEQLQALDRLRVYWSALPLSEQYMTELRGKCGRVEHATDGRGVVVYAVFPAQLFNIFRDFGIQAEEAGIEPPFRFIIPTPPDDPRYMNSDGSISHAALASSRFHQWLAQRAPQRPGFFSDAAGFVKKAGSDAWNWVEEHIFDPGKDYVETGFDYVGKGFDAAVDWTANALDDTWETIQEGLQEFVLLFEDSVVVQLNFQIINRDPMFRYPGMPNRVYFRRAWGEPEPMGAMPQVRPSGAKVRVRQWGWGFLPVMDEDEMDWQGHARLEAVKGAPGRGGDLCIELNTDYAMITTDLVPSEVCDFAEDRYENFEHSVYDVIDIMQRDIFALTQIKDSHDYVRTVIGHEPHKMDVLTGWAANTVSRTLNGNDGGRPMCPCLDFPSTGLTALTAAAGGMGPCVGAYGGLPTLAVGAVTGTLDAAIIAKDLWWPDVDPSRYNSRGQMTHEYGHFTMCSLLFEAGGPPALTGLIARIWSGEDSRDDEVTIMLETIADTFAMQVVGGSDYIRPRGSMWTDAWGNESRINYCVANSCMDWNYHGDGDYDPLDDFGDELARYQSLVHDAFDRADSQNWHTNQPWNGDVWANRAIGTSGDFLGYSPGPYIHNDDEPVSLNGAAWRHWMRRWLDRGQKPTRAHVIGGLMDVLQHDYSYNWCDRCEVIAPHHRLTPAAVRMEDPTGTSGGRTFAVRWGRWRACNNVGGLASLVGGPPEPYLNIDAACNACPALQHVDTTSGNCVPCPPGWVARGDHCERCADGSVPTADNECTSCGPNEISVDGQCVACRFGQGADRGSNSCVDCQADAWVDWSWIEQACSEGLQFPVTPDSSGPAGPDLCPTEIWVDVTGLHVLVERGSDGLIASTLPAEFMSPDDCAATLATVALYRQDLGGLTTIDIGQGLGWWNVICQFEAQATVSSAEIAAGLDSIRLFAAMETGGQPAPFLVDLLSDVTYPGCMPD